eukprot:357126-Rhodomonas_salina.1
MQSEAQYSLSQECAFLYLISKFGVYTKYWEWCTTHLIWPGDGPAGCCAPLRSQPPASRRALDAKVPSPPVSPGL